MGLLTKADSIRIISTPGSGLLQKVTDFLYSDYGDQKNHSQIQNSTAVTGGLLRKSLLLLHFHKEKSGKITSDFVLIDFSRKTDTLSQSINELTKDFSFPYTLYSLLQKEFEISHGILFMYSHINHMFQPWIYNGVASSSVENLQFALEDIQPNLNGGIKPFQLNKDNMFINGNFPFFRFPDQKVCIPLNSENGFSGALIASGPLLHEKNMGSFNELCTKVLGELGHSIYQSREIPLSLLSRPEHSYSSLEEAIAQLQAGIGNSGAELNFITFSLTAYFEAVKTRFETISCERIREDILFLCNSLILFNGIGFPLREHEILIIVNTSGMFSPALLEFHLSRVIKNYFRGLFDSVEDNLSFIVFAFPSDEKTLEQILAEI